MLGQEGATGAEGKLGNEQQENPAKTELMGEEIEKPGLEATVLRIVVVGRVQEEGAGTTGPEA